MILSARRCLKTDFYPTIIGRVKSTCVSLILYALPRQTGSELYSCFYVFKGNSTHLSGSKLAKFRYLRNFDSKGYVPLFCPVFSSGQGQRIHRDTCDVNMKYHWVMSLFNFSNGYKFKTPITGLSVLVDICKTSENGFTQYSVF